MKKIALFTLLIMALSSTVAWGQGELHLIYVYQDRSVENDKMIEAIQSYMRQHQGENYVVYYSDVQPLVMDKTTYKEDDLAGTISSRNSIISMSPVRELNAVSEVIERYSFNKLAIECFVGPQFFENNYHNSFLARFLLVNKLNDEAKASLTFHSCGASLSNVNKAFADKYSITIQPKVR
ncbi:MAG: hypothetical protein J5677_00245 [Bacteroidales bacterium]|nr:hypothetical protein [Bacteroidales bacterium]